MEYKITGNVLAVRIHEIYVLNECVRKKNTNVYCVETLKVCLRSITSMQHVLYLIVDILLRYYNRITLDLFQTGYQ